MESKNEPCVNKKIRAVKALVQRASTNRDDDTHAQAAVYHAGRSQRE